MSFFFNFDLVPKLSNLKVEKYTRHVLTAKYCLHMIMSWSEAVMKG